MKREKQKLLLHACCGPCSSSVLERLVNDYKVTIYFYNPNIYPETEYLRRKKELIDFINLKYVNEVNIVDADYNQNDFYQVIAGLEEEKEGGNRCIECFKLRLLKTAEFAKNNYYDIFTTTLTVSPHKNSNNIFNVAKAIEEEYKVKFLYENFKKNNGYLRSIEITKETGMYRQEYCGCQYSIRK